MWSYVNVGLAVLAGFAGGYVMALGAYWLEAAFGFVRLDFHHTGMQYVGGERPGWWAVGIVFHQIDSILLGLAYAAVARPMLMTALPSEGLWGPLLWGLLFGTLVWVILAMIIAAPLMGGGVFGYQTRSPWLALLSLGLHWIYGGILGLVYVP